MTWRGALVIIRPVAAAWGDGVFHWKNFAWCGGVMIALGLGLFVYATAIMSPYAGASGGGLSGLEAGLIVIGAMALAGLGGVVLLLAPIVALRQPAKATSDDG